jgi:hypothetical protein
MPREERMGEERVTDRLRVGQQVADADGTVIGTVADVWPDVGVGESWGAVGSIPTEGAEAADSSKYAFSEAMPGEGDSYFRVTQPRGHDLYVPFSALSGVDEDRAVLAVLADDIPSMQWDVRPDFLNVRSLPDSQAGPTTA